MPKKPEKPAPKPDPTPDAPVDTIHPDAYVSAAGKTFNRTTLIGDVRDALLDEQKHSKNPLPWSNRSEAEQQRTVERADIFARDIVESVMAIVAADGRKAITADRATVRLTPKGQIEVKMLMPYTKDVWTDLGESLHILIVPTGARNPYEGERRTKDSLVSKDQPDMLGDDPEDPRPGPDDDGPPADAGPDADQDPGS